MSLTRQCNMSYSRGTYAQAVTIVHRLKDFKRTMAPTLPRSVTTSFSSMGLHEDNAFHNNLCNLDEPKNNISNINADISQIMLQQCLQRCFFILSYACNMLVHTFKTFCNKTCCSEHFTLNKVLIKSITVHTNFTKMALAL